MRGSRRSAGDGPRWLGAGLLSVAVHGGVGLAAVALFRAADIPTPLPPPVSVEIVSLVPAPPAPLPARPPATAPAEPPGKDAAPAGTEAAPMPKPAPPKAMHAAPPAPPPPKRSQAAPRSASAPAARIVAAPAPRPRPARAVPAAARPRPSAFPKPLTAPVALPLASKSTSARATGNDGPPDSAARPAAGNPPPAYPRAARRRGLQGRLVLRVRVGADGAARGVEVIETSGHRMLDDSARAAVAGWRFTPARRAGAPVASRVDIPVSFRLERR